MKHAFLLAIFVAAICILPSRVIKGRAISRQLQDGSRTGAELYTKRCASCHGKDGRAKTFKARFNHARDLTDEAWQNEASDERLFNSIFNGRGEKMPAFGKKLSEQEINSLVAYIRTLIQTRRP